MWLWTPQLAVHKEIVVLKLQRKLEYTQGVAAVLVSLGKLHAAQNRPKEARTWYEEGLQLFQKAYDKASLAGALEGLAGLIAGSDRLHQAARLFGAAAALREETGIVLPPCDRSLYEKQLEDIRSVLGETIWKREWKAGQLHPLVSSASSRR